MKEQKPINFTDERGSIRDIFSHSPKDHCVIITSNKGAIRGNHYHKKTTQYTYLVSGSMTMVTVAVSEDGTPTGEKKTYEMREGDMVTHKPFEAHAMLANQDTVFLAFADGVRGGEDYEKDVYRLKDKLL